MELFGRYPWLGPLVLLCVAIWVASLVVVVRTPKFRRKWLWGLLTFASFTYSWSTEANEMIRVNLPLGSLYILWFWRFGPSPSAAVLEQDALRRQSAAATVVTPARIARLRLAYGLAVAASLGMVALAGSGAVLRFMNDMAGEDLSGILPTARYLPLIQAAMLSALTGLLIFLFKRPYWWGKLLCAWAGLAWTGFGLISSLLLGPGVVPLSALCAGVAMLVAVGLHQSADRRFSGSYLKPAVVEASDIEAEKQRPK